MAELMKYKLQKPSIVGTVQITWKKCRRSGSIHMTLSDYLRLKTISNPTRRKIRYMFGKDGIYKIFSIESLR